MKTIWNFLEKDTDKTAELADILEIPIPVAGVLCSKGIDTVEKAEDFFDLSVSKLHSAKSLPDIKPVIKRLKQAILQKEKIFVWGDYDVDGVTATAVVVTALSLFGADFNFKVPHRIENGYDLKPESVDEVLQSKATLLMSVDCGVLAFEAANHAKKCNLDLIITDHHTPSDDGMLPDCIGVVNPNRLDSEYPFSGLAGVGIAFKVMMTLGSALDYDLKKLFSELIEFVALGTVADVAPMIDENRILVNAGCQVLSNSKKPGIKELLKISGVNNVTVSSIGFQLGPRINAIGRLSDSMIALELMLEKAPGRAKFLAAQLDTANKKRQNKQELAVKEAISLVESIPEEEQPYIIVVGSNRWHPGLVGLIAGKLVEKFNKPALVCSINDSGKAKGSCRSTKSFHILNCLKSDEVMPLFSKKNNGKPIVGGHAFAAGFEIPETNLKSLREKTNEYAEKVANNENLGNRVININTKIQPKQINNDTFEALNKLAPFGSENEVPIFHVSKLIIKEVKTLSDHKHLKIYCTHKFLNFPIEGLGWRMGYLFKELKEGDVVDVVFHLEFEEYRGKQNLFMNILDLKKTELS